MIFWKQASQQLLHEFQAHPDDFLRQPTFRRCLHPNEQQVGQDCWREMERRQFTPLDRMTDPLVGHPLQLEYCPRVSPMTAQHLYQIWLIFHTLNPVDITLTVELGGGYGNFARVWKAVGYRGQHEIVDLAPMRTIQAWYLRQCGLEEGKDVIFSSGENLPELLPRPFDTDSSLFIATFSLSEMPMTRRKEWETVMPSFRYLLFAYNPSFEGVNNRAYFEDLARLLGRSHRVFSLPGKRPGHHYLLASRY